MSTTVRVLYPSRLPGGDQHTNDDELAFPLAAATLADIYNNLSAEDKVTCRFLNWKDIRLVCDHTASAIELSAASDALLEEMLQAGEHGGLTADQILAFRQKKVAL